MKKDSSSQQSPKSPKRVGKACRLQGSMTIGMDLGDKRSCYCVLDGQGEVIQEGSVDTTKKAMAKVFGAMGRCRIAIEVGTHSPWVSRLLRAFGHEVVVANPRQVRLTPHSCSDSGSAHRGRPWAAKMSPTRGRKRLRTRTSAIQTFRFTTHSVEPHRFGIPTIGCRIVPEVNRGWGRRRPCRAKFKMKELLSIIHWCLISGHHDISARQAEVLLLGEPL